MTTAIELPAVDTALELCVLSWRRKQPTAHIECDDGLATTVCAKTTAQKLSDWATPPVISTRYRARHEHHRQQISRRA